MTDDDKKTCYRCHGHGTISETRIEQDWSTGIALGTVMGTGYFPMTKTVYEDVQCPTCRGEGHY